MLLGLVACAPGSTLDSASSSWTGEIASYVVNHGDRTEIIHKLRETPDTLPRPLIFAALEDGTKLTPGMRVRIWGARAIDDGIRVQRVEILARTPISTTTTNAAPLTTVSKKPIRRWAFVLVDVDGGGNPVDKAKAQSVIFGADRLDSIRSYFREVSYGVQDLEGEIFGPFPYAMNGRCDTDAVAKALLPQVPGKFDQYLWYFGTFQKACNWLGIADFGTPDRAQRHSWYNGSSLCKLLVQEPEHNFGMMHSAAMNCTLDGKPVTIAWNEQGGTSVCRNDEYGNVFDPMGNGDCYHMNGIQKAYQGWLGGCNIVNATSSGVFTLYPIESACDGPQLLHIPFPKPRAFGNAGVLSGYYLELRAPIGRDGDLDPQVLVVVANDLQEARRVGNHNWLLDMVPETPDVDDAALAVGKTFTDALPGGPKFTVLSADATHATIKVELGTGASTDANQPGKGVCSDMTPFQAPGPATCVAPASPARPPATPDAGVPSTNGATDGGVGGGSTTPRDPGVDPSTGAGSGGSGPGGPGGSGGSAGTRGGGSSSGGSSGGGATMPQNAGGCHLAGAGGHGNDLPAISVTALVLLGVVNRRRRRTGSQAA
jgi:hypothetical protein